jgi:hypothetical protein
MGMVTCTAASVISAVIILQFARFPAEIKRAAEAEWSRGTLFIVFLSSVGATSSVNRRLSHAKNAGYGDSPPPGP